MNPGRILVVDDNISNLHLLVRMLSKHGYIISVAKSGDEAIQISQKSTQELILLDIMMSGLDGYATCEVLKVIPLTRDIPVIFLSALDDVESKTRGFEVGGVDFISKPFHEGEVVARVNTHLSLSRTRKKLQDTVKHLTDVENELRQNFSKLTLKDKKLQENEEKFRSIFSLIPNPIILTRMEDGVVIDCNAAMAELFDKPREKIINVSTLELKLWKSTEEREQFLHELTKSGGSDNREIIRENINGKTQTILLSSRTMDSIGEKIIITVGFDYTGLKNAQQQLRDSEEMYRNPVEQSPVGIFLFQDGYFRYINPRLSMMLGYSRDEMSHINLEKIIHHEDLPGVRDILFSPGGNLSSECHMDFRGIRSSGTTLEMELFATQTQFQGMPAIYGTLIDVTYRNQLELARYQSEKMYRLITENMKDVICTLEYQSGSFRYVSPSIRTLSGHTTDEMKNRTIYDILTPEFHQSVSRYLDLGAEQYGKNLESPEFYELCPDLICKDGSIIQTEVVAKFMKNQVSGSPEVLCVIRDITQRVLAEKEVRERKRELSKKNEDLVAANEELLAAEDQRRQAYDELARSQSLLIEKEQALCNAQGVAHLGNLTWWVSDNRILVSEEFGKIMGISGVSTRSSYVECFAGISQPSRDQIVRLIQILKEEGTPFSEEVSIILEDATEKVVRVQGEANRNGSGVIDQINLIILDITRQNHMEHALIEANKEKEILLREIHHRVKNNMQVISSLLSMQSRSLQDPTVQMLFQESQNRVKSLSLVHELLYNSESLKNIEYQKYLQEITRYLFKSHNISPQNVTYTISGNNVLISIEKAVPCSLVITELLTNSLKYAFPAGRNGKITIDFSMHPDTDEYVLVYEDDGVGFAEGEDPLKSSGFGTTLIKGLSRQLSGTLSIGTQKSGVSYMLRFPAE